MKFFVVRPIDRVLLFSLGGFVVSLLILSQAGSFGPCGPSDDTGAVGMICGLVSLLGIFIGLILSLIWSFKPHSPKDEQHSGSK